MADLIGAMGVPTRPAADPEPASYTEYGLGSADRHAPVRPGEAKGGGVRLLPVLKSSEWQGPQSGAQAHRWLGTAEEPLVYVGYAWESVEGLTYVTADSNGGLDLDEIVRRAFANLEEESIPPQVVETDGARILVVAGVPFAAEMILSERFMVDAHQALEADKLVVSVAKRGTLLACAHDGPEQAKATLTALHRESWISGAEDRITDRLVVVSDGIKSDTITVGADGSVTGWG